jgi:nucleoside-diphosphate-sugar epimerase
LNHKQADLQVNSQAIFVTGASGFIGQRLVAKLLNADQAVRVMVRPETGFDERIPQACEQIAIDITDIEKLRDVVAESSAVIYCAGSVRGRTPADFETANIKGVKAMLNALETLPNPPPLLLLSSLAASQPQLSDYAQSKYEGEQLLKAKPLIPWTILRPPAVYGPGDREMLPLLKSIRRGLLVRTGPREQRLSLLHVDDLVNAMISCLSVTRECMHKTWSIDDGKAGGYSWKEIGEAVGNGRNLVLPIPRPLLNFIARINLLASSVLGYMPMLTPGKVRELVQPEWLCDNSEFTNVSDWLPAINLEQGVQQLFGKTGNSSTP